MEGSTWKGRTGVGGGGGERKRKDVEEGKFGEGGGKKIMEGKEMEGVGGGGGGYGGRGGGQKEVFKRAKGLTKNTTHFSSLCESNR